jgi:hypothetical protein
VGFVRRQEGGQVFALTAVALTAMIGMCAFVIDVGSWYQVTQQAQAAADAGATAAANDLPANPSLAVTDAQTYVNKNISGATTTVTTPYNGDATKVKVIVKVTAPTFFAKIFGLNSVTVTESAAAKRANGANKYAVFAGNTTCGGSNGFGNTGSNETIAGAVRTNGSFKQTGGTDTYGPTTYGGPNGCPESDSGTGNSYGGNSKPTQDSTDYPWPEPWPTSAAEIGSYGISCTYSGTNFSFSTGNTTIPSGTYCYTGSISISGSSDQCTCTFIASTVSISGSSENFQPYYSDLLIDSYGSTNLSLSGSGQKFTGTVFVPNKTLTMSGSNNGLYNMFLEGLNVSISGSDWLLTGTGPTTGFSGTQLVE